MKTHFPQLENSDVTRLNSLFMTVFGFSFIIPVEYFDILDPHDLILNSYPLESLLFISTSCFLIFLHVKDHIC